MNSIVGFSIFQDLPDTHLQAGLRAQQRALGRFKHLQHRSLSMGPSRLEVWGHEHLEDRVCRCLDGALLVLIGSPQGGPALTEVAREVEVPAALTDLKPAWDGRFVLLYIAADGQSWILWNDWLGSLTVFHTAVAGGRVASTLEPVVVAAAGYGPQDFFLPGLVSLLVNGHFISDWTLYKGMHTVLPDARTIWADRGCQVSRLETVKPSTDRWEAGWDDLVDEMYAVSRLAVQETLQTQPAWCITLSSGLDSRLIAAVAADVGANVQAFAWGGQNTTDVNYSRRVAQTLGLPWQRIELPADFLARYTPHWADQFGTSLVFHGMYQASFMDQLQSLSRAPVISGFLGDVIAGDGVIDAMATHAGRSSAQIASDWYVYWATADLLSAFRVPLAEAIEINRVEIQRLTAELPGAFYQKLILLECWTRQRFFTSFQGTVKDYGNGVGTPFLSRAYATFCLSLPRALMDDRRLLAEVFRRHYGRLAVIPGTYAPDPLILTGKYLLLRHLARRLPPKLHVGPLRGFGNIQLRMDVESVQAGGRAALWPLFEMRERLADWLDFGRLEADYQSLMKSKDDIRPLRRLQAVQTLAYRLGTEL